MNCRFSAGQLDISSAINETLLAGVSDVWVLVNMDMTFYYRVNYDVSNWELLIAQLQADHQVKEQAVRLKILIAHKILPPIIIIGSFNSFSVSYYRCSVTSQGRSSSQTYLCLAGKLHTD